MRRALILLPLLFLFSCKGKEEKSSPTLVFRPVISGKITELSTKCSLPDPNLKTEALPEEKKTEITDWMQLSPMGGNRLSAKAKHNLLAMGDSALDSILEFSNNSEIEESEKLLALSLIGEFKTPKAASMLLQVLEKDPNPSRRLYAADSLAKTQQFWIIPRLLLRLKNEKNPATVIWIAGTLSQFGNFCGLEVLFAPEELRFPLLEYKDEFTKSHLIQVTRSILQRAEKPITENTSEEELWQSAKNFLKDWNEGRWNVPVYQDDCLNLETVKMVQRLSLWQLRDVDEARYCLKRLGPNSVPFLTLGLEDENFYIRSHSVEMLGVLGPIARPATPVLLKLSADPKHRADSLDALGKIKAEEAFQELSKALQKKNEEFRIAAAEALGNLGNVAAVPELKKALSEKKSSPEFVVTTALALSKLGDAQGLQILVSKIDDSKVDQDVLWRSLDRAVEKTQGKAEKSAGYFAAKTRAEKTSLLKAWLSKE